jgi:two-component system chemotaxis sensor kinase CheA
MTAADEEFLGRLRATFKVEAAEHLQEIGKGLLQLEKAAAPEAQQQLIETVFRAAHSLKGAARAVDFTEIESLCQSIEDLFAAWKRREMLPTPSSLDTAHRTIDKMAEAISVSARAERPSESPVEASPASPQPGTVPMAGETETVRITVSSLDARLLEAEEMLAAKLAVDQRAADLGALAARLELWRKEWARVQPRTRALRQPLDRQRDAGAVPDLHVLAEFLDWNHDYLRALEGKVTALRRAAEQDRLLIGKLVDDLLENSKKLLMLPLATLSGLLSKLVRDQCRDQGKEAELTMRGEEVTIDKRILEQLKDPLVHLLRNCIDHGIETPEQRRHFGKPPRAEITLTVSPVNSTQVEISVGDDGAGIDVEKVKAAAIKHGIVAPNSAQLSEAAALALVFETEVSTSPMITRVSGRGLGLAIVREKVEKLGGRVTIESRRGSGTTVRMTLPLTLATFRGVLVESARRLFILPTAQVERVTRFTPQDVQTVEGRRTLVLNRRAVALVDLAEVLQLPSTAPKPGAPEATPVLVLGVGEQRVAFVVDAVLDEREVLVKRLAKPLSRVRNIAGATVLGSGEVAPILNVSDLLKSARTAGAAVRAPLASAPAHSRAKRILVVEDSITSRMLLKGILESAGYEVKTAIDGIDGFTALRAEHFDLVVSDVEMPRMNGFDLTARIRADRALAEVPVVLVTALESREDRERGIDVGANAYLVKSSLDQSNLLEALHRLA